MTTAANQVKTEERRRSQRIPFRVPILVEGRTLDGKPFEEKTYTLEINQHGARIVLQSNPQPGGRVGVTNLQTKSRCPFQVVSRPGRPLDQEKGSDWGIECLDSRLDFWGISFPDKAEPAREPEGIDVLLECSRCRARESANLTPEQYRLVVTRSSVRRSCLTCNTMTEWSAAQPEGGSAPRPHTVTPIAPPQRPREQRQERRLAMHLPVRIRLEEIGETENLSPHGLCFSSELVMQVGDRVWLTAGYAPGGDGKEVAAKVRWRKELPGGRRTLYGAELEHDK